MRILGADIPDDKRVEIALTYVFGIGRTRAREILENTKIDFSKKTFIPAHTFSISSSVIYGWIGSDKTLSHKLSVTGQLPFE